MNDSKQAEVSAKLQDPVLYVRWRARTDSYRTPPATFNNSQLKDMANAGNLRNFRVMTDLTGDFNHVVMEHDVESAAEFEALMTRYSSDPQAREKAKGYTDLWTTGRRELFRVA